MAAMPSRTFLGEVSRYAQRQKVYMAQDCLEIDDFDRYAYEITRKRVYFEDVLAVTYHQIYGWNFLVSMGLLAGVFIMIALICLGTRETTMALVFMLFASPFIILFILRLTLRMDTISIYGKRTKAELSFWFRKQHARQIHAQIIEKIRHTHAEMAARYTAELPPAPSVPLPPGPETPSEPSPV